MEDSIFLFLPIIIFIIVAAVVAPIVSTLKNKTKGQGPKASAARGYNREVDSIHRTTDAATDRRHRLEQLKSLYEAGMMDRDEYEERVEAAENDYRERR